MILETTIILTIMYLIFFGLVLLIGLNEIYKYLKYYNYVETYIVQTGADKFERCGK